MGSELPRKRRRLPRSERLYGALAALACLLAASYLAVHARDEATLRDANRLALRGDYGQAIKRSAPLIGSSTGLGALLVEAHSYVALRKYAHAASLFRRAAQLAPQDWQIRSDLANTLQVMGRVRSAREQIALAVALNPRLALPGGSAARH